MNCENCKYYHKLLLNSHERKHCCTVLLQYPSIDEVCEVKFDDTCDKYEDKEQLDEKTSNNIGNIYMGIC